LCRTNTWAEATAQAPHEVRAGLAQVLLNGSCLRAARQTRSICPSIPLHDLDGPRLSCHHLVHHPASFLSPLMPPPLYHLILGRGRRSRHLHPIFVRHQLWHRLAQWLLHVHEYVSHHARTIVFTVVGRPVRLPSLRPVLPPQPAAPASWSTLIDAGTGGVGHAPGLSLCVSSRRTWWRMPRLGYLGDEESRSEILDNQVS
jgi:hypothetical protein